MNYFLSAAAITFAWAFAPAEVTFEADLGEPTIAQDYEAAGTGATGANGETLRADDADDPLAGSGTYFENVPLDANTRKFNGTIRSETITVQALISGKEAIVARHVDADTGVINWAGVAGENDNVHDHWVDTFGTIEIKKFDKDSDTLIVRGHTVALNSLTVDSKGTTTIVVQSQQGNGGGAHDEDILGTIIVKKVALTEDDITFVGGNEGVTETYDEFLALVETYQDPPNKLNRNRR